MDMVGGITFKYLFYLFKHGRPPSQLLFFTRIFGDDWPHYQVAVYRDLELPYGFPHLFLPPQQPATGQN